MCVIGVGAVTVLYLVKSRQREVLCNGLGALGEERGRARLCLSWFEEEEEED